MRPKIAFVLVGLVIVGAGVLYLLTQQRETQPTGKEALYAPESTEGESRPQIGGATRDLAESTPELEASSPAASLRTLAEAAKTAVVGASLPGEASGEARFGQAAGKVVDPKDEPVEGCEAIFLLREAGSTVIADFAERGRYRESEPFAVTNASGEFLAERLEPGTYIIAWRAPGYIYRGYDSPVTVRPGETTRGIFQKLERAGVITGEVVENITGKPIAEAKVSGRVVSSNQHEGDLLAVHRKVAALADGQGKFRLDSLLPFEEYDLTAEHSQYADAKKEAVPVDTGEPVRIVMSPGGSIEGQVLLETDRTPVRGARVYVAADGQVKRTVTSATDGLFIVRGLTPSAYDLHATHSKYRSDKREGVQVGWSSELKGIDLLLKPGPVVTGTVQDAVSGQPIAGATVKTDKEDYSTTTAEDGKYRFEGVPPEKVELNASAEGYMERKTTIRPSLEQETVCDFALEPGGDVEVLVTDPEQKPIPEVMVIAIEGMQPRAREQTDAEGHVRIGGVSLANPPWITAVKEGYEFGMPVRPEFPPGENVTELHIILKAQTGGGVFAGRVTGSSGGPIQGATVKWFSPLSPKGQETTTDSEGHYRLMVSAANVMSRLEAYAEGWAPAWKTGLTAGTEENPTEVNFELEQAHWLELLVVDPDDEPLEGIQVVVLAAGFPPLPIPGHLGQSETNAEGRLRIENLPGPEVTVNLEGAQRTPIEMKTLAVDQEHRLVMLPWGVIRGRVLDKQTEEPVTKFKVALVGSGIMGIPGLPGYTRDESFTASDGRFTFTGLYQNRKYQLTIEAADYTSAIEKDLEAVTEEEAEEKTFYLSREELRGIVFDALNKKPLAGATIVYAFYEEAPFFDWSNLGEGNPSLTGVQKTASGSDGSFTFGEGEQEGTLFLMAQGYENTILKADQRVYADSGLLEVPLMPGGSVHGQYHDRGMPLPNEPLLLTRIPTQLQGSVLNAFVTNPAGVQLIKRSTTDAAGMYHWESLAAGTYHIAHQQITSGMGIFRLGRRFELAARERKEINLGDDLGPYSLSGRILDGQGQPIRSGMVIGLTPVFPWDYTDFGAVADSEGRYRLEGLAEGTYEVNLLKVTLDGGPLYSNLTQTVEVLGDSERDFVFATGNRIMARLVFPDETTEETRSKYVTAVLEGLNVETRAPDGVSAFGHCFIQDGRLTFQGKFKGEYSIALGTAMGTDRLELPATFQLNNLQADQDLGEIAVPGSE